ncbi:MAG: hypothetical protein EBZ50_14210, partial [Alphaproteobacteria bacterium]|nr:hypothetical protein [Alphaproteobacteria bacterium]
WTAGAATARAPALTEAQFVFQRLNPGLVSWLQNYSLNLIREIDKGTVESVRGALLDGMRAGANPIETARSIRESVGLTERQSNAVRAYRRQLEQIHTGKGVKAMGLGLEIDRVNGRQVFKPDEDGAPKDGIRSRRLRDFRYDPTLQRAVATGKALTKAQIDKMVDAYRRKYLRHRSEVIARTESIRANNAGAAEAWRQAVASGQVDGALVRKRWIVGADERACRVCLEIPRMNPKQGIPIDALFATPIGPLAAPVAHPNCRCSLSYRIFEPSQLQENTP